MKKSDAYITGYHTAQYRANPCSFGYIPNFDYELQAKEIFVNCKENITEFMQGVNDCINQNKKEWFCFV